MCRSSPAEKDARNYKSSGLHSPELNWSRQTFFNLAGNLTLKTLETTKETSSLFISKSHGRTNDFVQASKVDVNGLRVCINSSELLEVQKHT